MRVLWGAILFALVCTVNAYDGEDEDEAKMAVKFDLEKELDEAHNPDHVYKDENEVVVEEPVHTEQPEDGDEESDDENRPMRLPPWFHLPPWLLPGFGEMFPFLPHKPLPPFLASPEEKYLRRMDEDDLPMHPMYPPLHPEDEIPSFEYPPPPRDDYPVPPPPRKFLPARPPVDEEYPPLLPEYPEPEFPPFDLEYPFLPPPLPYPMPPYPAEEEADEDYEEEDDEEDAKSRKRREVLVDTMTIHDPIEWWSDIDNGRENKVTKSLSRTKTGIASQYMMLTALDRYSPALHLGEIDTGYLENPETEVASDRTFGYDSDFYLGDMDAFRFTPGGQRYNNVWQFLENVNSGKIALGRRFNLKKSFFDNCFECWVNRDLKKVKDIQTITEDYSVDAFSSEARRAYWYQVSCESLKPSEYIFIAIKKDNTVDGKTSTGKVVSFVMFFQDMWGHQIAVVNPNMMGMQASSPFTAETNFRTLARTDGKGNMLTKTYLATQPDISHIRNAQYTATGGWFGKDQNPTFYPDKGSRAPYDESEVWRAETGGMLSKAAQNKLYIKQGEINAALVGHPYKQTFNYPTGYYGKGYNDNSGYTGYKSGYTGGSSSRYNGH